MGLDIRYPIGIMFAIVGALLVIFGLTTSGNTELYRRSLGININLWWGLLLLAFGLLMLFLAWRAKCRVQQPGAETQQK
jgi:protein-S-isoprenylcysteine O-methyltransferase Ste14